MVSPSDNQPVRQVLLVLGMHRSGTSATAGLLAKLGARMARNPIRADTHNARGYWEPEPLVSLHNRLLAEAGSAWNDWGRLDHDQWGATAVEELAAAFTAEFGDAPLAVLKDPRICRFAPLWLAVLDRLGVAPKVVVTLRHPLEVARSLARRDGMPEDEALLLWLRHCLEAEHATRGVLRSFLRYDDLVTDWRAAADRLADELRLRWPVPPDAAAPAIDDFLSGDMRHHDAGSARDLATASPLAGWVDATYAGLWNLARGDAAGLARLDEVRTALDAADDLMGTAARRQRAAATDLTSALAASQRETAAAQAAAAEQAKAAATQAEAVRRYAEQAAAAHDELTRARASLSELADGNAQLQQALDATMAERAALLSSTSWRLTAPLRAVSDRIRRTRRDPQAPQKT